MTEAKIVIDDVGYDFEGWDSIGHAILRPKRRHWKVRAVLIREMVVSDWPVCKHIVSERTVENSKQRLDDGPVV